MHNTNSECHLTVFSVCFLWHKLLFLSAQDQLHEGVVWKNSQSCTIAPCSTWQQLLAMKKTNLELLDRAHPMLRAFSYQVLTLVSLGQIGPLHGFAQCRVCGVVPSKWMLSLNTVPLAALWIALFGRITAFFSQSSGA